MGDLLTNALFDRNAFRDDAEQSARTVHDLVERVEQGYTPDATKTDEKIDYNTVTALTYFVGLLVKPNGYRTTRLWQAYLDLYRQDKVEAWRWLATRALWRFVVPNGTQARLNTLAKSQGITFSFFHRILAVLTHLDAHTGDARYLYYDELLMVLDNDQNWKLNAYDFYQKVLDTRGQYNPSIEDRRALLGSSSDPTRLEPEYGIRRDNYSGVFNNLFDQTGLFDYIANDNGRVGIAISSSLDSVLRRRIRFILDHPLEWNPDSQEEWAEFLQPDTVDLPKEVSETPPEEIEQEYQSAPIEKIVEAAVASCKEANLAVSKQLVRRFIASLLAKRFLILTGLSGSGKTKLAQFFATWITPKVSRHVDPFLPGATVEGDKKTYRVQDADALAVEFWNSDDENAVIKVTLPRALIREWANAIKANGYTRGTSPKIIEEAVDNTTKYSGQLNSFHSNLKAAAFALIEVEHMTTEEPCYEVVAVGADWTSTEQVLGYADALDTDRYARTQALDVILGAKENSKIPHFLVLDEMNLSHVERYFADLLSAMESGEPLHLHEDKDPYGKPGKRDGVPARLRLPSNLFVVGTVNVDETTYMFSPKVLDRANVIEFRASDEQMKDYLDKPKDIELDAIAGSGVPFAEPFVAESRRETDPDELDRRKLQAELMLFFHVLSRYDAEFAYRSAREIARFVSSHKRIVSGDTWDFRDAFDAQVIQKLLPKLHGSRSQLEPILCALALLCARQHKWKDPVLENATDLREQAIAAARLTVDDLHPLTQTGEPNPDYRGGDNPYYPLSFDKIRRMLRLLQQNGFTSFAEA